MLSISAFNALLKIIEEPPEHLLFILATTELHKVPSTILSRCQRFSFRRISQEDIAARLQYVAYQEEIELDDSAARVLARLADGGMRDGLSLLDQCASATTGDLTAERVYACLGIAGIQECGKLMGYIAQHDTGKALGLFNRFYSEGKDIGALMDELACLTRDLMIMKTAPKEGISMLSGIASDQEVKQLDSQFSMGELVRILGIIQQTVDGFVRSASKRVDAELCIVNLCQPELVLDGEALNARLTRLEDQLRSGSFQIASPQKVAPVEEEEEYPPMPGDEDAPPEPEQKPPVEQLPTGQWVDIVTQAKKELPPWLLGYFGTTPDSSVVGVIKNGKLVLLCNSQYVLDTVNKPEVLEIFARKTSVKMGAPIQAVAMLKTSANTSSAQFEKLMDFGRGNPDIIHIKD